MKLIQKKIKNSVKKDLESNGVDPQLAQILSARNISSFADIDYSLDKLIPPFDLKDCEMASLFLAEAIEQQKKIIIIGDYDADGASGSAIALLGFQLLGLKVDSLIPSRFKEGYGLSPAMIEHAKKLNAEIIITVDNGIASFAGVDKANELGIDVVITDHHLQGDQLPKAKYIINPNQSACSFASKNLCGAGVIFYLLLGIRRTLRERDFFSKSKNITEPNLMSLIDLVALATIADVVSLDFNNRILVHYGLRKIRSDQCNLGIKKLFQLSNKKHKLCESSDLGFIIAPKINAAGRMDNMSLGVLCLTANNELDAHSHASQLFEFNKQRKFTETKMQEDANSLISNLKDLGPNKKTICLFDKDWHQGVVGILASRIKESHYRPVIIFAADDQDLLKGSARSINGLHIRDTLDYISKKNPNIILSFGGHAMAAGLSIKKSDYEEFSVLFENAVINIFDNTVFDQHVEYDQSLLCDDIKVPTISSINSFEWGNGFLKPIFIDEFECLNQSFINEKHSKFKLQLKDKIYTGIYFNFKDKVFDKIRCLYSLDINSFNNQMSVSINIRKIIYE